MQSILIIGSGGREHALARAFAKSSQVGKVYVAPGNPGMVSPASDHLAAIDTVAISVREIESLAEFVVNEGIDLTFVGSEEPLEMGIVDLFNDKELAIVGPTQYAAQLESSKNFAKEIMRQAQVATAQHAFFPAEDYQAALAYLEDKGTPIVIKADGLMAGKGVVIPANLDQARADLKRMMLEGNSSVVIEELMVGPEFSHFSLVNGDHIIQIGTACDYKRVHDNDQGLNTGGMGAFAPVPWFDADLEAQVLDQIVRPVAQEMVAKGTPFTGVLYTGLMLTKDGPKVIEFNTRFGDPETQILLPLLENDFMDIMQAHLTQEDISIQLKDQFNLGVVKAANGYPGECDKGMVINIAEELEDHIYYAGVSQDEEGQLLSSGGRILMVTASGKDLEEARMNAYKLVEKVEVNNCFHRSDIGLNR